MISVEELSSGVYVVDDSEGKHYTNMFDGLPKNIRDKLDMLRAADIHTRIEGVGTKLSDTLFWITEEGAEADDYDGTISMMTHIERAHYAIWFRRAVSAALRDPLTIKETYCGN